MILITFQKAPFEFRWTSESRDSHVSWNSEYSGKATVAEYKKRLLHFPIPSLIPSFSPPESTYKVSHFISVPLAFPCISPLVSLDSGRNSDTSEIEIRNAFCHFQGPRKSRKREREALVCSECVAPKMCIIVFVRWRRRFFLLRFSS